MKNLSARLLLLATLICVFSCSKTATETMSEVMFEVSRLQTENSCISELRPNYEPPDFYHNGQQLCPNFLQYQFFGNFGIDSSGNWYSEINCVQNPKNWTFGFYEFGDQKLIQMTVHYPRTVPADGEPNIYLSSNNFRLRQNSDPCQPFGKIDFVSGAGEGNRRSWLLISLQEEFWECEPQEFDFEFHVLGTFGFPVVG